MVKVGLTGGIGSGKSFVAALFAEFGVPVYQADIEAKMLIEVDPDIVKAYKSFFGNDIYTPLGLNRKQVATLVFGDQELLKRVNQVVHPAVARHFDEWLVQHKDASYVIHEAAILFESKSNERMDRVITVSAPESIRMSRVMERDGVSEEAVKLRMNNQMKEEERLAKADYVILNDELQLLLPQVVELHHKLIELSKSKQF